MNSYTEIVNTWGVTEMAFDLGVPKERVRGWMRYNMLPPANWRRLLEKAPSRNIDISPDLLIDLAARE